MNDPLLLMANARPCACAEFTRLEIGPFSIPIGILTALFAGVALLMTPGILAGWLARRREARAMSRVLEPDPAP